MQWRMRPGTRAGSPGGCGSGSPCRRATCPGSPAGGPSSVPRGSSGGTTCPRVGGLGGGPDSSSGGATCPRVGAGEGEVVHGERRVHRRVSVSTPVPARIFIEDHILQDVNVCDG